MYYHLQTYGVSGGFLEMIKQMHSGTMNMIRINNHLTPKFESVNGVMQGNNISPTIFGMYINNLLHTLNRTNIGIQFWDNLVNNLAYADDIVLLSGSETDLTSLMKVVEEWCSNWQVMVNVEKTKIIHFRQRTAWESTRVFKMNNIKVEKVPTYQYLGVTLEFDLNSESIVIQLFAAGSRALDQIIGKTRSNYDLGFGSFM